jgi:GTP-binding protein Era
MNPKEIQYKSGYVAIIGEPNVGKSTLLNSLLNQKISIVTNKPQTTRQRILGILSRENAQIIFIDTPGLIRPKYLLQKEMIKHAKAALTDSDIILIMISANGKEELPEEVSEHVLPFYNKKPMFLVINKVDLVDESKLAKLIKTFSQEGLFKEIIPISALKKDNVEIVLYSIIKHLPEQEAYYPSDVVSEYPERFFVSEFIREQVFKKFREEIPYSSAVEIRQFKDRDKGKTLINADIIVERESQKGILIGNKGSALKIIGIEARKEIEEFLQREVFLELHVKVSEKWRDNKSKLRQFGYSNK